MEFQGYVVNTPREAIKQSFQSELLPDGHLWLKALDHRNLTSHTYNEKMSLKAEYLIKEEFFPGIKELYILLKSKL